MTLTVFAGETIIARGSLAEAAAAAQAAVASGSPVLAFDDSTGRVVDLDLRGSPEEVAQRHAAKPRGRGRPKLGVTAREVTLLPRHWEWLSRQRGGASATLRRLVEEASRQGNGAARQDAAYRAATALAGDLPGYEEAMRALFANDIKMMQEHSEPWPEDIRRYVLSLARGAD